MSIGSPESTRVRVHYDELDGLLITIPAERKYFAVFSLAASIASLLVIGISIIILFGLPTNYVPRELLPKHRPRTPPFPFVILLVFLLPYAAIALMHSILWHLRGIEFVRLTTKELAMQRAGGLIRGRPRTFELLEISNLRYAPMTLKEPWRLSLSDIWERQNTQMLGSPSIAFDVAGRTYRLGVGLSETESRRLIKTITNRYKIAEDPDEPFPIEPV